MISFNNIFLSRILLFKKLTLKFTLFFIIFTFASCSNKKEEIDPATGLIFSLAASSRNVTNATLLRDFNFSYSILKNTTDNENLSYSSSSSETSVGIILNKNFTLSTTSTNTFSDVTYSISPAIAAPATFSTTTATITGIYTVQTTPQSIQYTITGTLPASTQNVNNFTFSKKLTLFTDSAANINNITCQFVGTGGGCIASIGYTCNAATQCSSSSSCNNITGCTFRK